MCNPVMQNISDEVHNNFDIISFEDSGNCKNGGNIIDFDTECNDDCNDIRNYKKESEEEEDKHEGIRMRGGCGGGGGGSGCCCSSSGGKTNVTSGYRGQSPCSKGYQGDRNSTIEGSCGCSGRAQSGCGSSGNSGGCCSGGEGIPVHLSKTGGSCNSGSSYDEHNESDCASRSSTGYYSTGRETCPPRTANPCSPDPSSLSPCGVRASLTPCSGRKSSCPPAGCKPVCRKIALCNSPCTGDTQSCGGGGCCGSGCRGGCGKPGQTCMPSKPCTIPPCLPHPQGGGSPCRPPRRCPPQPSCCRSPVPDNANLGGRSGNCGGGSMGCCR